MEASEPQGLRPPERLCKLKKKIHSLNGISNTRLSGLTTTLPHAPLALSTGDETMRLCQPECSHRQRVSVLLFPGMRRRVVW
jgi:hypothetical protein